MPLQGVWTADEGQLPPWKGDYHHDLNTELSYSHYLKANHLEEGESFLDFLWNLRPAAREFAQSYYQSSGINLPSVMTIDGNYDLSLLRYLFGRLKEMAERIEEREEGHKWSAVLEQLPELAVNHEGLMLSPDETLMESHRHLSHAMAIYPLRTMDYHRSESERTIIDHTIHHLEKLGKGLWVGYTFAWMAATENLFFVELFSEGKDTAIKVNLWVQSGHESVTAHGTEQEILWVSREFSGPNLDWPTRGIISMRAFTDSGNEFILRAGQKVIIAVSIVTNHDVK